MKDKDVKAIIFIAGLVIILLSPLIGYFVGESAIKLNGGVMDTSSYEWIIESVTISIRTIGAIFSLIGGLGLFCYKNKN